jgi:outer membrane protein, heavy metal efflux system
MKLPEAGLRMAQAMLLMLASLSLPAQAAGLSLAEALDLARQLSPALRAQQAGVAGAAAEQPAAASLPDPRLTVGVENVPVAGADSFTLAADPGTMQRIALMQEVPNRAKRDARSQLAQARTERQQLEFAVAELQLRREVLRAWVAAYFATRRVALVAGLQRENALLQQTLPARIAAGQAMAAELTMARQEALAIDDRHDELVRDLAKAQAALRRLVGPRGDAPPLGEPPALEIDPAAVRGGLHRHTELAPFDAMQAVARAEIGESEADARGDWSWELVYNRRQRYADMVSFELSFDLPLRKSERQDPRIAARRKDLERIEAEREDTARRHEEEVEAQLAELQSLDAQADRLQRRGLPLAAERVALTLAAYQAGRSELAPVLAARSAEVELRLRALALDAERTDLRVRLNTLIAE